MIPSEVHRWWPKRRQTAVVVLFFVCQFGLVTAAYGQTDIVTRLIADLKDPKSEVRQHAAAQLRHYRDPRSIEALIAILKDTDKRTQQFAAAALGNIGAPAVGALIAALDDPDARGYAAYAFCQMRDPRAIDSLVPLLQDQDPNVRWRVTIGLGQTKDPRAVEPLIAALTQNRDSLLRTQAAQALEEIGAPAVESLATLLNDPDRVNRWAAINILATIDDPRAVEALTAALKDSDPDTRSSAASALNRLNNSRAVRAAHRDPDADIPPAPGEHGTSSLESRISELKSPDSKVREAAAVALGGSSDPRAFDALLPVLADPDTMVQWEAFAAIGQTGDPRAIPHLIGKFKDPGWGASMAANSLAQIGESAIEPLLAALKSPDGEIRRNAALALGWIKDPRAASALQQAFEKRDTEVIVGAYAYFIGRGEPGSEDVLIEALNKSGDLSMDKAFRECGNERLEQASRTWVPRTGNQRRGTYGGVWGHPW